MSHNDKIRMPSSGAGITQFFDDYKSKIEFQPYHVVIIAAVVILAELVLWVALG